MKVLCLLVGVIVTLASGRYSPDWASLDQRPLPSWFDEAKFGIFIHWGVFSAPAYGRRTESAFLWMNWKNGDPDTLKYIKQNYPPDFTYADFGPTFRAEFYDPYRWADILKNSGAKYVVLTSKHHEGFTNWPSKVSWNWNSMEVGPKRDLVGDLAKAIRNRTDLRFGLYHSLFEFYNDLYLEDKANRFKTQKFVESKTMPELYEIVNAYKPDVIWSDGEWEAPDTYWNSTNFVAWLYNDSPVKDTVVTNDRWGQGTSCHHGGFYTCSDKYNPKVLQKRKWENCLTLDRYSWGYRRTIESTDFLSMDELTQILAETISCGGNMLLNIGPTGDGRIDPMFEERLKEMGDWLKVNGEAVYSSKPWTHQNDTVTDNVWYTSKPSSSGTDVYAFMLKWPKTGLLTLGAVSPTTETTVSLLGYQGTVAWNKRSGGGIDILMPVLAENQMPCKWAWIFKLVGLNQ